MLSVLGRTTSLLGFATKARTVDERALSFSTYMTRLHLHPENHLVSAAQAEAADRESEFCGRRLAEANCYGCHAVALYDESLDEGAPHFRELAVRPDVEVLRQDMAGDLSLRHPEMPDFEPTPAQIDDLVDYIESLAP